MNKIALTNQLTVNPGQIDSLNNQFPQADYHSKIDIAFPGTQAMRMSTGLEIQVVLPIVQAPFRVYYAYNPLLVRENVQPPVVFDRSMFPNAVTFNGAIATMAARHSPISSSAACLSSAGIGRTF